MTDKTTSFQCRRCKERINVPPPDFVRQVAELFPMTVIGIVVKYVCGKCAEKQTTEICIAKPLDLV